MSQSLYHLTSEYLDLQEALVAAETEEQQDAVIARMVAVAGDVREKVDGYGAILKTLAARASACKSESKRLADRAKAAENAAARLKARVMEHMQAMGLERVEGALFTASVQLNPPAAVCDDAAATPPEYLTAPPPQPNKSRIRDELLAGRSIPGWRIERGQSLRFR